MTQDELASVPMDSRAPAFEVATRSAVKRAASVFGLADNLWQGHDHGQDFDHYSQQPRQPDHGQQGRTVAEQYSDEPPPRDPPPDSEGPVSRRVLLGLRPRSQKGRRRELLPKVL